MKKENIVLIHLLFYSTYFDITLNYVFNQITITNFYKIIFFIYLIENTLNDKIITKFNFQIIFQILILKYRATATTYLFSFL